MQYKLRETADDLKTLNKIHGLIAIYQLVNLGQFQYWDKLKGWGVNLGKYDIHASGKLHNYIVRLERDYMIAGENKGTSKGESYTKTVIRLQDVLGYKIHPREITVREYLGLFELVKEKSDGQSDNRK